MLYVNTTKQGEGGGGGGREAQWFRMMDIAYGDHVVILFNKQFFLHNPNLLLKEEIDIIFKKGVQTRSENN